MSTLAKELSDISEQSGCLGKDNEYIILSTRAAQLNRSMPAVFPRNSSQKDLQVTAKLITVTPQGLRR
jgi:hypothetical protein